MLFRTNLICIDFVISYGICTNLICIDFVIFYGISTLIFIDFVIFYRICYDFSKLVKFVPILY